MLRLKTGGKVGIQYLLFFGRLPECMNNAG